MQDDLSTKSVIMFADPMAIRSYQINDGPWIEYDSSGVGVGIGLCVGERLSFKLATPEGDIWLGRAIAASYPA